jgi:hypothetical protein
MAEKSLPYKVWGGISFPAKRDISSWKSFYVKLSPRQRFPGQRNLPPKRFPGQRNLWPDSYPGKRNIYPEKVSGIFFYHGKGFMGRAISAQEMFLGEVVFLEKVSQEEKSLPALKWINKIKTVGTRAKTGKNLTFRTIFSQIYKYLEFWPEMQYLIKITFFEQIETKKHYQWLEIYVVS